MEKRTRVLLADANEEFRILLRQLLEETGEFEVTAADGLLGWGCCWQALWVRRRSRCTNSGKSSGNDPSAAIGGTFLIAETACRFW